MATTHSPHSRRRLDVASLLLLALGLIFGVVSYLLVSDGSNPLVIVPSVVATTLGAIHIVKHEAVH